MYNIRNENVGISYVQFYIYKYKSILYIIKIKMIKTNILLFSIHYYSIVLINLRKIQNKAL